MGIRDGILIFVALIAIAAGIFLPQLAEPLEGYPRICLMCILFLSFLGLRTRQILADAVRMRRQLAVMLVGKLFIAPAVTFFLVLLLMPKFALGALLLAGTPAGVITAFFAILVRADFSLALAGIVCTSLLAPFTLPLITSLALSCLGFNASAMSSFSPLDMSLGMAVFILGPYLLAQITQTMLPQVSKRLLQGRFWVNCLCMGISNLAVFATYSPTLKQQPDLLLPALAVTLLAGVIFFFCGIALAWRWPLAQQATMGLCIGVTNGIMAMILGMDYFGLYEILPSALFAIPTILILVPVRLLIRLRTGSSEIPVH